MNTHLGLIGKKLGNTQIFEDDGNVTRVTAIEVGPCTVLGKRTVAKDGYSALILGFGERTAKHVNKAETAHYAKIGQKAAKVVRELRMTEELANQYEVGAVIKPSEIFAQGQFVDVTGMTVGRGFTGVMKRWNFRGSATATHGTHEYQRHGGAIGTNMTPGRTLPNLKMPGQYGNERVTVQNQKIARIMDDEFVLLVAGAVPGPKGGIVTVRGSIKKKNAGKTAAA